jgi:hypothetical protein
VSHLQHPHVHSVWLTIPLCSKTKTGDIALEVNIPMSRLGN